RLRWHHRAIFPDVDVPKLVVPSLAQNTFAAWLWSGRNGVITGRAAAAMHGALWVSAATPIEMIWRSGRPPPGIVVRNERIDTDEIIQMGGLWVTTPVRTAFDIARHLPRDLAVQHLDSLTRATSVTTAEVLLLAEKYLRARGLPRARIALALMDAGAQSQKGNLASSRPFRRRVASSANADSANRRGQSGLRRYGLRRTDGQIGLRNER